MAGVHFVPSLDFRSLLRPSQEATVVNRFPLFLWKLQMNNYHFELGSIVSEPVEENCLCGCVWGSFDSFRPGPFLPEHLATVPYTYLALSFSLECGEDLSQNS